jgi:hypothetical protein
MRSAVSSPSAAALDVTHGPALSRGYPSFLKL